MLGCEQARDYATEVMALLDERSIPLIPENYAVWFEYLTGENSQLRRAIDILESNSQELDLSRNRDLFDRFVLPRMIFGAVDTCAEDLEAIVAKLAGTVSNAGDQAQQYGEALQSASVSLGAGNSATDVHAVVASLIDETRAAQRRNATQQQELSASAGEIEALRKQLEDSRREAEIDALTGIPNRKSFDKSLRSSVTQAMETGNPLCLLMIDIDFFKKFNDNYGHPLGDQVLRLVARTLCDCVRNDDLPARYGGEEFSVVLPGAALGKAVEIGERIRHQVGAKRIVKRSSGEDLGSITLSVGVAQYVLGEPIHDLVERADQALYAGKTPDETGS